MATITATQEKQFGAFKTPHPQSSLWMIDPGPDREDKEDKKTPKRARHVCGDFYVLVETVNYLSFPSPDERARAKDAGKPKPPPRRQFQLYIHLLHSTRMSARTLKVYKHQGKMLYADSLDYEVASAQKSTPPKDRETMVWTMARLFGLDYYQASAKLREWSDGL